MPVGPATSTTVKLVCGGVVQESWDSVLFNEIVTKTLQQSDTASSACNYVTEATGTFILEATSGSMVLAPSKDPFGGELTEISPPEVASFLNSLPISGSIFVQ